MALQGGLKEALCDYGLGVRLYYLECLAQATYIISHNGVAFIVDPRRDVDIYKVLLSMKRRGYLYKGILRLSIGMFFPKVQLRKAVSIGIAIAVRYIQDGNRVVRIEASIFSLLFAIFLPQSSLLCTTVKPFFNLSFSSIWNNYVNQILL